MRKNFYSSLSRCRSLARPDGSRCLAILILLLGMFAQLMAQVNFTAPELLGRPTDHSVTVNLVANTALQAYFKFGATSGAYTNQTSTVTAAANEPIEAVMDGLAANTRYYYRTVYSSDGGATWTERDEHSFITQRPPGSSFTFTIISDSHLGQYGGQTADELALYQLTLQNIQQDNPDFHIDLGDTYPMDPQPLGSGMTEAEGRAAYLYERPYLGQICHSIPFFQVLGNHENEEGWNFDDTFTAPDLSLAVVGLKYRKLFYPTPIQDDFYTANTDPLSTAIGGDTNHEDYYAWTWGDALFVALDPFHYSKTWPAEGGSYGGEGMDGEAQGDRWDWSLGIQQYLWLKSTLENSTAKFKFLFIHHVTGGNSVYGRGGITAAPYFEWGGKNADGTWGFDAERPASAGWDVPVHQLMVDNGVSIFFHGHDHIYAAEALDDIVYLECPKPDDAGYTWEPYGYGYNENHYPDAVQIPNSGHIRVTVTPDEVTTEYVRSYLSGDGENRVVAHTVTVEAPPSGPTHVLTLAVDPVGGGATAPTIGDHTYTENRIITLTATAATGYAFDHWTGDVADVNAATTTVTMDVDKTVTAHFTALPTYTLTMAVDPSGSGETVPAAGVHSYAENTVVNVTASPAAGYVFDHWTGQVANGNSASTTVTMDGNKTITAHFRQPEPGELTYLGSIGSATSKTSGATLVLTTTAAVAAGDAIIIAYASDPYSNLTVNVTDAAGNTYQQVAMDICYGHVRTYLFAAYHAIALASGSAITITANSSVTARAAVSAVFRGLAETNPLDLTLVNPTGTNNTASGTQPTVGPTGTTAQASELLIAAIGTEGPVEDNAGIWDYSFMAGPRAGTTGSTAATNMTVCLGYRIVDAVGAYSAQKTGITSSYWGAIIATCKAEEVVTTGKTGDINGDDAANSTDALIVLSCDVGIDVSSFCPMNCGDVNSDGEVNSTDALIILSYDVGMEVAFPIGEAGCPTNVTACSGCNP